MSVTRPATMVIGLDAEDRSFEAAFRASFSEVHRMVARLMGPGASQADVEDVTQLVFLAAYRAWPKFRGDSLPSTWMYGVAARVVMRQLRGFGRHRRLLGAVLEAASFHAMAATPESKLSEREELLEVWRCLMQINPKKRLVYVMHDLEGRTPVEIAELLQVPKDTVASRLRHARSELALKLKSGQEGEIR